MDKIEDYKKLLKEIEKNLNLYSIPQKKLYLEIWC